VNAEAALTAELDRRLLAASKHYVLAKLRLVAEAVARGMTRCRQSHRRDDC
jgi:hypothetical protein